MGQETGYYLDISEFDKGFHRIAVEQYPELTAEGMFLEGAKIIKEAIEEEPRAPHLEGRLWGSQRIVDPEIKTREISMLVGFDIVYAARLHEMPTYKDPTLAGSGPKFLESKLSKHGNTHMKNVADFIKRNAR